MTRTELMNAVKTHEERAQKLYSCNARFYETAVEGRRVFVLESYQTLVACLDVESNVCYVFGWWSRTTNEHTSKFAKMFKAEKVFLYNDSRTLKADAERNESHDFANKIKF